MKKIISLLLAAIMCFMLFACSEVPVDTTDDDEKAESETKVNGYSEKDFLIYDESGKVLERPLATKNRLLLSETEGGVTSKKVAIGDDAISALEKYDLCYGKSAYNVDDGEPETLTKKSDLKSAILSGDTVQIIICLDENYEAIDTMDLFERQQKDEELAPYYMLGFLIEEGKIADAQMVEPF